MSKLENCRENFQDKLKKNGDLSVFIVLLLQELLKLFELSFLHPAF